MDYTSPLSERKPSTGGFRFINNNYIMKTDKDAIGYVLKTQTGKWAIYAPKEFIENKMMVDKIMRAFNVPVPIENVILAIKEERK